MLPYTFLYNIRNLIHKVNYLCVPAKFILARDLKMHISDSFLLYIEYAYRFEEDSL